VSLSSLVLGADNPDDPSGKEVYVVSPSCGYYKCKVNWARGSTQHVTWWNAPAGGLNIHLVPTKGSGKSYTITSKVGSIHDQSSCKAQAPKGESCGSYEWKVPTDVALGEYTVEARSVAKPKVVGYTDTVVIGKTKGS
ncbi:hypothetical protein BDZ90DRAFT_214422, partial [Jaminaea rosea]